MGTQSMRACVDSMVPIDSGVHGVRRQRLEAPSFARIAVGGPESKGMWGMLLLTLLPLFVLRLLLSVRPPPTNRCWRHPHTCQ